MKQVVTEAQLQSAVIELATLLGFSHFHVYNSRRSNPGWPDLTLCKGRRLLFVELKTAKGRVGPMQDEWLERLRNTGAEGYLWRPMDWESGEIEAVLRGNPWPPASNRSDGA